MIVIIEGIEFKVPGDTAPMYNNLSWEYVIKEYVSWGYTTVEINDIIKKEYEAFRLDSLEILLD